MNLLICTKIIKRISQARLGFAAVTLPDINGLKQQRFISHSRYISSVGWWGLCSSSASPKYSGLTIWNVVGHCNREREDEFFSQYFNASYW